MAENEVDKKTTEKEAGKKTEKNEQKKEVHFIATILELC
jgi:hypothetical protein